VWNNAPYPCQFDFESMKTQVVVFRQASEELWFLVVVQVIHIDAPLSIDRMLLDHFGDFVRTVAFMLQAFLVQPKTLYDGIFCRGFLALVVDVVARMQL